MPHNFLWVMVVWHVQFKNGNYWTSQNSYLLSSHHYHWHYLLRNHCAPLSIWHWPWHPLMCAWHLLAHHADVGCQLDQLFPNMIGAQHPFPQLEPGGRHDITSIASDLFLWAATSSIIYCHSSLFDLADMTFHADLVGLVGQHDHSFMPT